MSRDASAGRGVRASAARVRISYEPEDGGPRRQREIPFVLGVLGDFSGSPEPALPRLRERKFVEVDASTFSSFMASARPRLTMQVDNRLRNDGSKLAVELRFAALDDFEPEAVTQNVEPLRRIAELRGDLAAMLRLLHERKAAASR